MPDAQAAAAAAPPAPDGPANTQATLHIVWKEDSTGGLVHAAFIDKATGQVLGNIMADAANHEQLVLMAATFFRAASQQPARRVAVAGADALAQLHTLRPR